ncbi:MAG: GDYXXLXY domain-containing protein [Chromatiaceae bacterium]|nr:GDYXXLXY domain-containing protein [Chromatiaceae bacterium]
MSKAAIIAAVAGLLVLGIVNLSIVQKETLLREGDLVFLELAPVDPRSLMQGDYMALRFQVGDAIRGHLNGQQTSGGRTGSQLESMDGRIIVSVDERSVGHFVRLLDGQAPGNGEKVMQFRVRNGQVRFATNAFFFQEGTADVYTQARYGEFRVGEDGELLLVGVRDKDLRALISPGSPACGQATC